jgi:ABC-2 type transport system permease protein
MNDLVEIGVFAGADIDDPLGAPLYFQKHRIKTGSNTITVIVKQQPGRVGVDPHHWLIQRKRQGKVVALETVAAPGTGSAAWKAEYRRPKRDSASVMKQLPRGL